MYATEEYKKVKEFQQAWEDNQKEITLDESIGERYFSAKNQFERLLERVKAMGNVLDYQEMPKFELEVDKRGES